MANVNEIVERIKNAKAKNKNKEKGSFSLVDYNPKDSNKGLEHIDKFLKVISANNRITISYADVKTACINIKTNEIILPNYITKDRDLYLLMGSHEVSHAMHTPSDFYSIHNSASEHAHPVINGIKLNPRLMSCINTVEDIRIEKLIRNKFPGFVATYERGYAKLIDTNESFQITDKIWKDSNIDIRINIKAKLGNQCKHELNSRQAAVFKYLKSAVTFDDVLIRSVFLYKELLEELNELEPEDHEENETGEQAEEECENKGDNVNTDEEKDPGKQNEKDDDSDSSGDSDGQSGDGDNGESDSDNNSDSDSDGTDSSDDSSETSSSDGDSNESGNKSSKKSGLEKAIKEALDDMKNAQKSADALPSDTGEYSKDLLQQMSEIVDMLNDADSNKTPSNQFNPIEEAMDSYQANLLDDDDYTMFSSRNSRYYKNIIKDPISALVSMY